MSVSPKIHKYMVYLHVFRSPIIKLRVLKLEMFAI
jgi:hypothetical protein